MIAAAKKLLDAVNGDDASKQCTRNAECHRLDGHDGSCKSLGVVLVEKAGRWLRGKVAS